eukprot:TRINITY_DN19252_c0_g1_i1.p1 TRINITY_DN19252_c0_g1~~TRINITY_DN19252_c0_g1_i1.p1  ORF type:complete len:645 (+),score=206.64 TRINITY_DN19252_c0_g1_i1:73-2007(+)
MQALAKACDSATLGKVVATDPQIVFSAQADLLCAIRDTLRQHAELIDALGQRIPVLDQLQSKEIPKLQEVQNEARREVGALEQEVQRIREDLGVVSARQGQDEPSVDVCQVFQHHIMDSPQEPEIDPPAEKRPPLRVGIVPVGAGIIRRIVPLADQVRELKKFIVRNIKGRERCAVAFLSRNPPDFLRRYLRSWMQFRERRLGERMALADVVAECRARVRPGVERVLRYTLRQLLPRYWMRLLLYSSKRARAKLRHRRALRRVQQTTRQERLRVCWRALADHRTRRRARRAEVRAGQRSSVDRMALESYRIVLLRYYGKLARLERRGRARRQRVTLSQALLVSSGRLLCRRYWSTWSRWLGAIQAWQRRQRVRRDIAAQLSERTARGILTEWMTRLRRFAAERRALRDQEAIVARVTEMALQSEQSTTEAMLELKRETDTRVSELRSRHDVLGSQVDIGLGSLSNTNHVLNRIVDRLLVVDEHLDTLHKDKVGRAELAALTDMRSYPPQRRPQVEPSGPGVAPLRIGTATMEFPQVSPPRDRGAPGVTLGAAELLGKQKTAFMGPSGLVSSETAEMGGAQVEMDRILARIESRQRELSAEQGADWGPRQSGGTSDVAELAQRELEMLRLRDLERRLGGQPPPPV